MSHLDEGMTRHPPRPLKRRSLSGILRDLEDLSPGQFRRVWDFVSAGVYLGGAVTIRYLSGTACNRDLIGALHRLGLRTSTGHVPTGARPLIVALWVQDNPFTLRRPRWGPNINVVGAVPV